jgi:hypothetical protein
MDRFHLHILVQAGPGKRAVGNGGRPSLPSPHLSTSHRAGDLEIRVKQQNSGHLLGWMIRSLVLLLPVLLFHLPHCKLKLCERRPPWLGDPAPSCAYSLACVWETQDRIERRLEFVELECDHPEIPGAFEQHAFLFPLLFQCGVCWSLVDACWMDDRHRRKGAEQHLKELIS